jgi:hypothetical protein
VFYIYFHHHLELCLHCTRVHRLVRRAINLTSPKTLYIGLSDAEAIELTFANGSIKGGSRLREPIPVATAFFSHLHDKSWGSWEISPCEISCPSYQNLFFGHGKDLHRFFHVGG